MPAAWAARIRQERKTRSWDVHTMARKLRRAADDDTLPDHEALVRSIRRWESGRITTLSERYRLLFAQALSIAEPDLFPETGDTTNRRAVLKLGLLTAVSATSDEIDALELAQRVNASDVGPDTLDRLEAAIDDLATAYPAPTRWTCWTAPGTT